MKKKPVAQRNSLLAESRRESKSRTAVRGPLVRFRHIGIAAVIVGVVVLGPLFTVWKQVYVREICIRREVLSDSLSSCQSEIAQLRLNVARLSQVDRIEKIARTNLHLVYPDPEHVVVVNASDRRTVRAGLSSGWNFLAILKRSLSREQS